MSNVSGLDDGSSEEEKDILPKAEQNLLTRQGYLSRINEASDSQHLLDIIEALCPFPNNECHF